MAVSTSSRGTVRFGVFEVDLRSGELRKSGVRLKLQDQPFQVLAMLLEHSGEVVTRDEFRQKLWPADTFVDFDDGLNTAIKKLRDALGDSAESPRFIETLPKRGYRFIGPVNGAGDSTVSTVPIQPGSFPTAAAPRRRWMLAVSAAAAVLLLLVALNFKGLRNRFRPASVSPIRSIAVLPLQNLSGDPSQEYFADGMTDALTTSLAQISSLRVISRTTAMQYKGKARPVREIARELNVDAVVEGSVVRSGDRVRITAQLIHAPTDSHLWAQSYERNLPDLLTLQTDVVQAITDNIRAQLTPRERERLARPRQVNPEAYDAYLKGRFSFPKWTSESTGQSIQYFQQAIEKDPNFAAAYAWLSESYRQQSYLAAVSPLQAMPQAETTAHRALELDPDLAEGHRALAAIRFRFNWDWHGAEQEYQQALALNPNDAQTHWEYAVFLRTANRYSEAITAARRAADLDPSPTQRAGVGAALLIARQYDLATEELQRLLAAGPRSPALAHQFLGVAYQYSGRPAEAIAELEESVNISHRDPSYLAPLAHAYAYSGRADQARKILAELQQRSSHGYVSPFWFALIYAGLGEKRQALAWLERSYNDRSFPLVIINSWPYFDPLRSDPQFQDLVRRIGLDPAQAIPK